MVVRLERSQQKDDIGDYMDSSPPPPALVDFSDVESHAGSIDSIQRNADFCRILINCLNIIVL